MGGTSTPPKEDGVKCSDDPSLPTIGGETVLNNYY